MSESATFQSIAPQRPAPSLTELAPGTTFDRYVVLGKLGEGGMGVVYAAYDPKLDRKVALKLVRRRNREAEQRLEREARAMARLRHENVVSVHDAANVDGQVYIAMEFVQGETVTHWIRAKPRSWREIVDAYVQAGRGLVAAHDAGLVHRDFKPDNVMIAASGRVVVMDFGVARVERSSTSAVFPLPAPSRVPSSGGLEVTLPSVPGTPAVPLEGTLPSASAPGAPVGALDATQASQEGREPAFVDLTVTGALVGTPVYMAPEQHEGSTPDARSDQFSFCVALYEGVYGQRPFTQTTWVELADAVTNGRVEDAPDGAEVPAWLRRVLLRGLAVDPAMRWPTTQSLLDALTQTPARRGRYWTAGGIVALAATSMILLATRTRDAPVDPCASGETAVDSAWDLSTRIAIQRAFLATGASYAPASFATTAEALDRFSDSWKRAHRAVCEATWVRHEQSAALLDARMACLDDRRREIAAMTSLLRGASVEDVRSAASAISGAETTDTCPTIVDARKPLTPFLKGRVEPIRDRLANASALRNLGRTAEALKAAAGVADEARAIGHAGISANVLFVVGRIQADAQLPAAEATLRDAVLAAEETGIPLLLARCYDALASAVGYRQGRPSEGEFYARAGAAVLVRAGNPPRDMRDLNRTLGHLHLAAGKYDVALVEFRRVLESYEAERDTSPKAGNVLDEAAYLNDIGVALWNVGKIGEAREYYQRSLALREVAQGSDHPEVAITLGNIANTYADEGNYAKAEQLDLRALRIRERAFGPDAGVLASTLSSLGNDAINLGRPEDALRFHQRAVEIAAKAKLPASKRSLYVNNVAATELRRGRFAEARSQFELALALLVSDGNTQNPRVAKAEANLAKALSGEGQHAAAVEHCDKALGLAGKVLKPEHRDVPQIQTTCGAVLTAAGRARDALVLLEAALKTRESTKGEPTDLAETRIALAEALLASKQDALRARTLAERARETFAPVAKSYPILLARIDAFLKKT